MNILKTKKQKIGAFFGLIALLILPGLAAAVPFTTDLSISGSIDFDQGFALADGDVSQTGTFLTTEGTTSTTSTFSGTTVTGAEPLPGTLTDLGDGFGMTATILSVPAPFVDTEFALGFDFDIGISNTSGTDTYRITVGIGTGSIGFENSLNTSGDDAFADSDFSVSLNGSEVFFSDLISDTSFGNSVADVGTGGFGGLLSESGPDSFIFDLAPGTSASVTGFWDLEGGVFSAPGFSDVDFSAFVSIDNVENLTAPPGPGPGPGPAPAPVPEPGTVILLGSGLIGLVISRKYFKKRA